MVVTIGGIGTKYWRICRKLEENIPNENLTLKLLVKAVRLRLSTTYFSNKEELKVEINRLLHNDNFNCDNNQVFNIIASGMVDGKVMKLPSKDAELCVKSMLLRAREVDDES